MARSPAGQLPATDLVALFHRILHDVGLETGQRVPRRMWDDLVMTCFDVSNDVSVRQKTRLGEALGLWTVHQAHGKGGRGYVEIHAGAATAAS